MSEQSSKHDLETGLLQRVRSWRDVVPPLVMLPSLRVAGSPIYITFWIVTAIAIWATLSRESLIFVIEKPALDFTSELTIAKSIIDGRSWSLASIFIGFFPAVMTMRAGALYAAGRDGEGFSTTAKLVSQRATSLLLVFALPGICVLGLSVPILCLSLLDRIPWLGDAATELLSIPLIPFVILTGMVAAGSVVAVPMGWVSVAIEKRKDPFDALSRGYEYLYRRPVQTVLYFTISFVLATLLKWVAAWVAFAAYSICEAVYWNGSGGATMPTVLCAILKFLPTAVFMTTLFATLGAVYLLLRKDANQQEVEDVPVSDVDRREYDLPTLREKKSPN